MAFMQSARDPRRWAVIKQNFLIGRDESCDLVLPGLGVSKRHALICWDGQHWIMRDLMSRNGIFVRSRGAKVSARVPGDRAFQLVLHDTVMFAELDEEWVLGNVDAPRTLLAEEGSEPDSLIVLDPTGVVAVPSDDEVRFVMHRDRMSGAWMLEEPGFEPRVVTDGELIAMDDRCYRLYIVETSDTQEAKNTPRGVSLAEVEVELRPTPDEERAALSVSTGRTRVSSGLHAHLYLLVHLARRRLKDTREGLGEDQCGWMSNDEVQSALGYGTVQHLSVDVFRCRKDIKDLSVSNAAEIVERGRHGHLRIGVGSERLRVVDS